MTMLASKEGPTKDGGSEGAREEGSEGAKEEGSDSIALVKTYLTRAVGHHAREVTDGGDEVDKEAEHCRCEMFEEVSVALTFREDRGQLNESHAAARNAGRVLRNSKLTGLLVVPTKIRLSAPAS